MTAAPQRDAIEASLLARIESVAASLAAESGRIVEEALQREVQVTYKPDARGREATSDPVSEVDRTIETLLRQRIAEEFPGHALVGEEDDTPPEAGADFVWVVDPLDGTSNFVNGFPLFAVSIGVLYRGRPVAGAVWCATTHALHPGVYHASKGGVLYLDAAEVSAERATRVKRTLAAAPGGAPAGTPLWDHRVTGSMAIEAAYVAAGVFAAAPFWAPKIWDVAAGIVLIRAAGREVWTRSGRRQPWTPFERFEAPDVVPRRSGATDTPRTPSLRDWRGSLLIGTPEAVRAMRERATSTPWWQRLIGGHR